MSVPLNIEMMFFLLAGATLLVAATVLVLAVRVRKLAAVRQGKSVEASTATSIEVVERRLDELARQVGEVRNLAERTIQHVGVVRYDAFQDVGGHISFSLALLDPQRNGVVLSVLNGRDGSRGYAKAIQAGRSSLPLSEEEERALAEALRRGGAS